MPKSAAPPKLPIGDMVARSPQVMRLAKVTYDERSPRFLLHLQALDHPSRRNWTTVERICSEMTTTEKDYVSDITALIKRFLDPLAAFADQFCNTKEELPAFTAVRCSAHFILGVHKELYKLMEPPQRRFFNFSNPNTTGSGPLEAVTRITKAFASIIDYMKVYAIYCANFLPATEELKSHAKLLDEFRLSQSDDNNEPPFDVSDLIKPVQRICRYSLLLRSLVKNATSHEEEALAQQALENMQQVSDLVNARVRDAENNVHLLSLNDSIDNVKLAAKMQLLRPGRTLLCEMPAVVQVMDRRARLARALHLRIMKQQNPNCQHICERASVNSEMELLGGDNSESEREASALRDSLTSNGHERDKDRQRVILLSDALLIARKSKFRLRVRRYICLSCAKVVEANEAENEVSHSGVTSKSFALLASKTGSCNCHNLSPSTLRRPVRRRYSLSRSTSADTLDGELLGESLSTAQSVPRTARQYIVHCETEEKKKEFVKLLRNAINRNVRSAEPRRSCVSVAATNLSAKLWQSMKLRNFSHTLAMRLLHRDTTTSLNCQDEEINVSTDESNSEEPHSERLLRSSRLATPGAA
ncbi:RhoGEF domain-containing protein gxcJ [Phytophthora citrophthora]|uniref:RhoGEF domain-containing protein gxcJ n=1 Tax=Phytophthora citrophthora TaxID=4793 RepID=A0AAD9LB06_9STRA|nr:RhoGEF domain-containing protein gxcJ [Phytophthora citrophthora]